MCLVSVIIMMSCCKHKFPWLFLATRLYCLSLPAGLPGYILYRHRAAVESSSWLSNFCSSMWEGLQEYIAYDFILTSPAVARMSGLSNLDVFMMGGSWPYSCCFMGCCLQDLFNTARSILVKLLSSFFSISTWCIYIAVLIWLLLGNNCISFYRSGLNSIWPIAYW